MDSKSDSTPKVAPRILKNLKIKVQHLKEQRAKKKCPKAVRNEIVTYFHKQLQEREIDRFEINSPRKVTFEALWEVAQAQQELTNAIVTAKIKEPYDPTGMHNPEPQGSLADLNKANWAHSIRDSQGRFVESVSDLDCLIIWMVQRDLENPYRATSGTKVFLKDMAVDIKTMEVTLYGKPAGIGGHETYTLVRDEHNERCRCHSSTKGYREQFNIKQAMESGFPRHKGEFGFRWKAVQNNRCQPSIRQVVTGLQKYVVAAIQREKELPQEISVDKYGNQRVRLSNAQDQQMVDNYSRVFDRILELAGIEDTNQPLAVKIMVKDGLGYPIKAGLLDPENRALQLILWLYSIEPSFQEDLARACLEMDDEYLETLGPYAAALYTVFQGAEFNRKDKLVPGIQLHAPKKDLYHDLGTFSGSHIVFRGTQLTPEWIEDWTECVDLLGLNYFDKKGDQRFDGGKPGNIFLQGNTSTSESFRVALSFAQQQSQQLSATKLVPVIFVISLQNYRGISGFRLNSQAYSAHDHEQEFLLMEGMQVFVIKVEEVTINFADHEDVEEVSLASEVPGLKAHLGEEKRLWQQMDGKTITFIHLFNENW